MLTAFISEALAGELSLPADQLQGLLESPPRQDWGDAALPCFFLAKSLGKSPALIAQELAGRIQLPGLRFEARGPYLNVFADRAAFGEKLLGGVLGEAFGSSSIGEGRRVVIDMSSPNIAKPFSVGHLRSTMIGNSLYRIYKAAGYEPVSVNHLGDWGTQFGKQIAAYKRWGDPEAVARNPIQESLALYVRFHEEAEKAPELEDEARDWFRKLEQGDAEARSLWSYFVEVSLAEFRRMYDRLGVAFDHYLGESFYNDKMDAVVQELQDKKLLVESDGAQVVRLEEMGMPPCLILKSDGTTIYGIRDLATAIYRRECMQGDQLLYVVGAEQSLHFRQVFGVLRLMGREWAEDCAHIAFGMMKYEGRKMSTRKGRIVFLEDVLDEAVARARTIIEEKRPDLPDKDAVAEAVGIGAIIFGDLKNNRLNDVDFVLEDAVNFDGETGPYVQYTHARTQSVLERGGFTPDKAQMPVDGQYLSGDDAWALLKELSAFPNVLEKAVHQNEPSVIARYLLDACKLFNRFYHHERILADDAAERQAKLHLTFATGTLLRKGLYLLGMQAPEQI